MTKRRDRDIYVKSLALSAMICVYRLTESCSAQNLGSACTFFIQRILGKNIMVSMKVESGSTNYCV